jgi:hypothetical protein
MFSADSLLSSLKTNTPNLPVRQKEIKKASRASLPAKTADVSPAIDRQDPKQVSLHNSHIPPPSAALGRIHLTQIESIVPAKYLGDVLDQRSDERNKIIHALSLTTATVSEEGAESIPEVYWGKSYLLYTRSNPT